MGDVVPQLWSDEDYRVVTKLRRQFRGHGLGKDWADRCATLLAWADSHENPWALEPQEWLTIARCLLPMAAFEEVEEEARANRDKWRPSRAKLARLATGGKPAEGGPSL